MAKIEDYVTRRGAEQAGIATEGRRQKQIQKEFADEQTLASLTPTNARSRKIIDAWSPEFRQSAVDVIEKDYRRLAGLEERAVMPRAQIAEVRRLSKREAEASWAPSSVASMMRPRRTQRCGPPRRLSPQTSSAT